MARLRVLRGNQRGDWWRWIPLLAIVLTFAGCIPQPKIHSLSDAEIQPLLKAMERTDRESLGFTPLETNIPVKLEVPPLSARAFYDEALTVYGNPTRWIAFRKTLTGYRWISEHQTYEGPNWSQTLDGTFREQIVFDFQTEPVATFPINKLSIQYTGSGTNFNRRELSLPEARAMLDLWKGAPVAPRPPELPDASVDPAVFGGLLILLAFMIGLTLFFLMLFCLSLFAALAGLGIGAALLAAGIVSTSVLAAILARSVSRGFRVLCLQLGAFGGLVCGAIGSFVLLAAKRNLNSNWGWTFGITLGLVLGIFFAWLFNKLWVRIAAAVAMKWRKRI